MIKCRGCGSDLQYLDQSKIGYIPKNKFNEAKLCERCFKLINYNTLKEVDLKDNSYVINKIKSNDFVFFLIDFLNINEEVINTYKKIKAKKFLIISKADYIPKYINKDNIKKWLINYYEIKDYIIFLSTLKEFNINFIMNIMEDREIFKAYLVGYTNTGKSTFINKITNNKITTSFMPNTTIDFIKIDLGNNKILLDTPGFQYKNPIYKENLGLIKKINPKKFLKPITFQLKESASIVIENIIRIENKSLKCNMTMYISNLLKYEKIYSKNDRLKNLKLININIKKNYDLVIKGIGFINFKNNCILNIYINNKENIEVRKSFFGG